ncbi:hypothetical protein JR316_0013328 [Psilocybe cubensis]|uniref:Protein kinase domain-containing protein n=2 Tax=Psilocybe cubensis TaxID=181762 RepID=A0A8H7XS16_PSICU|nr:hypothetical protein JR316_0013328 [Psilocybe cubensis]KAH9474860.1 hypothetical protein JR316_0013328 [Psilocybe cubensis]
MTIRFTSYIYKLVKVSSSLTPRLGFVLHQALQSFIGIMDHKQSQVTSAKSVELLKEQQNRNISDGADDVKEEEHSNSQPISSDFYVPPRERLDRFLKSPQTPFKASKNASRSTASRKASFFDLHLHPELQLRRIIPVKDLPEKVSSVCDDWISTHLLFTSTKDDFPINNTGDLDNGKLASDQTSQEKSIKNENALAASYGSKFGTPLALLSSNLIFKPSKWTKIFEFELSPRERHAGKKFATPDGFLCISRQLEDEQAEALKSLCANDQKDIQLITKHNLHHMMLWEFKSLYAGSRQTLDKFSKLAGDFKWPTCSRERKEHCKDSRHDRDGRRTSTGRKVGFDSRDVKIINEIYESVYVPDPVNEDQESDEESDSSGSDMDDSSDGHNAGGSGTRYHRPTTYDDMDTEPDTNPYPDADDVVDHNPTWTNPFGPESTPVENISIAMTSSKATAKKKTVIQTNRKKRASKTFKPITSSKKISKKKKKEQYDKRPPKPRDMIIQIWSAMVKFDATILILNAGNYEIIFIRNRARNTLFMSDVFKVDDLLYRKTQISLHGLAFYDARDRSHQLEALETTPDPIFPPSYHLQIDFDPYPPVHPAAAGLSQAAEAQLTLEDVVYDFENKVVFNVLLPKILSGKASMEDPYDKCMLRDHKSTPPSQLESKWILELGDKITDKVYPVVVRNGSASFSNKFVVKVTQNKYEYKTLKYELQIHRRVETTSFGVKVFGILEVPNSNVRMMLMNDAGVSYDDLRHKRMFTFAKKHRNCYVEAINALHEQRLLHGNPKSGHFLISKVEDGTARVSIVSYKPQSGSFNNNEEDEATIFGRAKEDELKLFDKFWI